MLKFQFMERGLLGTSELFKDGRVHFVVFEKSKSDFKISNHMIFLVQFQIIPNYTRKIM